MRRILQNKLITAPAAIIAWLPVLFVSFINDDFQILGHHSGGSILSIFAPFWKQDISVFYWRPVGNMLHPSMLLIFGFNPLPYRILSLVLYSLCCIMLAKFIEDRGVKKEYAVLASIAFAVLPSHEYQIAWIADQGESLVTLFLLLAFFFYRKNILASLICFTLAVLTKESAFAGILIPVIYYILNKEKYPLKKVLLHLAIAFIVIVLLQIYRYLVPGGTPFNSSNFEATGPLTWIKNFITYIPISFVQPEFLELISHSYTALILFAALVILILFVFISAYRKLTTEKKRIVLAGIAWFIFFILPALPKFMRWYVFTASAGLFLSIAVLFEQLSVRKYFLPVLITLLLAFAVIDFSVMLKWKNASAKMDEITKSFKTVRRSDDLFLFAVPEKVNNVPLMKLGINETVKYSTGIKDINVYAILRTEFYTTNTNVDIKTENDSVKILSVTDGRFKNREGRASSFLKQEKTSFTEEGITVDISNGVEGTNRSEARVTIPKSLKTQNMYYDGKAFIYF